MISRRLAIGAIGGGLALAAAPSRTIGATVPLAPDTPAGRMRAFMLMRGALDDRLVIGCLNGRYWGCVNGVMTPLFDVVSATFSRYRQQTDGSYRSVSVEQAYFLALDTGEWLQSFTNPYTGKTVKVPTGGYPPTATIFTTDLAMQVAKPQPGMVLNHISSPFIVQGDDIMMTEVITATTTLPGGGKPSLFHEVTGLHARLSEIRRPDAKKVRCETSYTSVKSWRSWLDMGDHPGETVSTGQGLYGATLAGLPAPWLAAARQHRPELLADPLKILDPLWRQG
jgi:hypothetical protein